MDLRHHLKLMSGWHVWTFERLYACIDPLGEEDYRKDAGLFFKSVHGTLNHMLLIEKLWAGRLSGHLLKVRTLGDELVADRTELRTQLLAHASTWGALVASMSDNDLSSELVYRSVAGDEYALPRVSLIHTMFTHGAHHRGQITTALHQWGKPTPELDFPYYLLSLPRESRTGVAVA